MRYAISGASRGIGLEFVRQLLARGDTVEAGARVPSEARQLASLAREAGARLRIHSLDITDTDSVKAFASRVGEAPVDVLINNAGIGGKWHPLVDMDFEDMSQVMETNAVGPIRLSSALIPFVLKGNTRKIVHLTTHMASLADNTPAGVYGIAGGAYAYRMSKAALNAGMRTMAVDFREQGLITAVLSPGWVQTDMGGKMAPTRVEDSVQGMLRVIDELTLVNSGRFFDYQGKELPW
ncbi:SDR family oxidoreductase [Hyalangium minutum]|uniref:SDR family oxidoreductase n=1 Tax=Hyalangium minutum TaxID=394096 RepID=UPI0005C662A8|nr:SDR family oxidoreductase [Hyalangium minutum]